MNLTNILISALPIIIFLISTALCHDTNANLIEKSDFLNKENISQAMLKFSDSTICKYIFKHKFTLLIIFLILSFLIYQYLSKEIETYKCDSEQKKKRKKKNKKVKFDDDTEFNYYNNLDYDTKFNFNNFDDYNNFKSY